MDFSLFGSRHARRLPDLKSRSENEGSAQTKLHGMLEHKGRWTGLVLMILRRNSRPTGLAGSETWTALTRLQPASFVS
jgi:hypothetical protein